MKDVKNHAIASECHHPGAASVLVVSLKCVLRIAMRLTSDDRCRDRCSGAITRDSVVEHHGQYYNSAELHS